MTRLARLLRPRSIAVLGAGWAANVIEQCQKIGFSGPVWPVHPTRTEIRGLACYPALSVLPEAPDAVFIGVNRHATVDVVAELSAMGAGRNLFCRRLDRGGRGRVARPSGPGGR